MSQRPIEILLVEDNPGDVFLTTLALKETKTAIRLSAVENGVEALAFLHRTGDYTHAPRPDFILLDLNMPLMDGREVLAALKADSDLRCIPVIVLTTSDADNDVLTAYNLQASCYVTKPTDLRRLQAVVQSIEGFWLSAVRFPPY